MRRVQIAIKFNVSPDDFEPEQYDAHFGEWMQTTLKSEFENYNLKDLEVTVTGYDSPSV